MDPILSLAEMTAKFSDEWVLLDNPQVDRHMNVTAGRVVWHSKDRDDVYQKAIEFRLRNSAVLFTGQIPENTAVIL